MAYNDTPWCGRQAIKMYLQSGQFTSTQKTSQYAGTYDNTIQDISWDGTNTPWIGSSDDKLYLTSGQFTSTLKESESLFGIESTPTGISWDRDNNTPWNGSDTDKLYLQSGQFSSTIKTSISVVSIDTNGSSISYDGTNTPWCGMSYNKLYLQSGQFTSTVKDSQTISDVVVSGITFDGTNTPWIGSQFDKLNLTSGQFTSTIKTSEYVGAIDNNVTGISTNYVDGRLPILNVYVSVSDTGNGIDALARTVTLTTIPEGEVNYTDVYFEYGSPLDLVIENGDLKGVQGFDTAIYASLFTDARASEDQVFVPEHRRGWLGNTVSPIEDRQLGGLLWLADQRKLNQTTLNDIIDYARKSLNWFVEDGILKEIIVTGEIVPLYGIALTITMTSFDGETSNKYIPLWEVTGA